MPVLTTYPGVYIDEVSSGVRTITGVATSITAFLGRAKRGPVNKAVTINSFGDFEREFGGLWAESTMSFAVRDFFLNGGSQAIIVRFFQPFFRNDTERSEALTAANIVSKAAEDNVENSTTARDLVDKVIEAMKTAGDAGKAALAGATAVANAAREALTGTATPQNVADAAAAAADLIFKARLSVDTLNLEAAFPGKWGNSLRARIDHDVKGDDADYMFNLSIKDGDSGRIEVFRNVSVKENHLRRVDKVLGQQSKFVHAFDALPQERPKESDAFAFGADPFSDDTSSGVTNYASDGNDLEESDYTGSRDKKEGLYALEQVDLFNLLCIPPFSPTQDVKPVSFWDTAAEYCRERRAMLIVDAPSDWISKAVAVEKFNDTGTDYVGTKSNHAALFFPRLKQPNPEHDNRLEEFAPCGAVAGIFARTDAQRGVWKAPAGLEARLKGVPQLSVPLTDLENGELNPLGINCLRFKPAIGPVVWGARTLEGDDRLTSEWKYIPVRRMALFIEESLFRGTQWIVFEPNDEPLWALIRLNIGAFMHNLFRQGAFQGATAREAYFVKCDKETTTQNDINLGIVNIAVGFAPLKPAEFVIITIQQMAGQIHS